MSSETKPPRPRIFLGNPYDLETVFESLSIASTHDKELLYLDRLLARIRSDPTGEITTINFSILEELGIIEIKKIK